MLKLTCLFHRVILSVIIPYSLALRCPSTTLQVQVLGKQLDEMQAGKQELVTKYEGQLQHLKEEVSHFKITSLNEC